MNIIAIIPARMGSSRFPGKPLKKINGMSMIEHVYFNVKKNKMLSETIVATCDNEIKQHLENKNINFIMTSKLHTRASDRCAEALIKIEKKNKIKYDIVVMVQGDEPMVHHNMINQSLRPILKNSNVKVVNLYSEIKNKKDWYDKNCVKVIKDNSENAVYFSRNPIPYNNKFLKKKYYKQICIIPFRRKYLLEYIKMKQTFLEKLESIDMLRILENGDKVKLSKTNYITYPVDTLNDLKKVSKLMKNN